MVEKNDWRLMGQEDFLMNAKVCRKRYKAPSPRWDHDHCVFCTDKFMDRDGYLREGYCTLNCDGTFWICDECFEDFKEMFHFELVDAE